MTPRRYLWRSLRYHWPIHLAVALGVAVGAAVLAGALLVGDSVRGSLRDLTLDRLGAIDHALVAERYFREELAEDLAEATNFAYGYRQAAPAILIRGGAESAESGARASRINIHGVDGRFFSFYDDPPKLPGAREVLLNRSLAREIGAAEGDGVLVRFQTDTLVPSESVMGRKAGNTRVLRLTVSGVIDDRGPGRFGLSPSQQLPFNAYLPLKTLQRALDQEERANAIFVSGSPEESGASALNKILADTMRLDDLNLRVEALARQNALRLDTGRVVLEISAAAAAERAAQKAGLRAMPVLTYLANHLRAGEREVPYSTVTALDFNSLGAIEPLVLTSGETPAALGEDEILINDWTAKDLRASPGDKIELAYYVVAANGSLETKTHEFTLKGVVRLSGLGADRELAPAYEGMSEARRMGDWDPPFPVDLTKIRPIDEDYWESYRGTPKAFVSLATAKRLWTSRFGQLTSIRLLPVDGQSLAEARTAFLKELRAQWRPEAYGLAFRPVKALGLKASSGATDFSGLFLGFSLFLIVSAAMLVALLFRLGVERRAKEIGLLRATGQSNASIRRLLIEEGAIVSLAGCLAGLPGAVAYSALMIYGLRTWWSAAVGGSFLELHVTAPSLIGGAAGALLMMVLSIWLAVRKLDRLSPRAMLAGDSMLAGDAGPGGSQAGKGRAGNRPRQLGLGAGTLSILLLGLSFAGLLPAAAGFFGMGALLLVASLAFFRASLASPPAGLIRGRGPVALARLGARNGARSPARSMLSAGLVASATFLIVTVSLFRHDVSQREPEFGSGDGGFRFIAESDLPLYDADLQSGTGLQTGADPRAEEAGPKIFAFRVKPGDDASCLNLYQPSRPTLLGAAPAMIARGGFGFNATLAESPEEEANPWLILDREFPDGAIPVFGDMNSVLWILHLGLGQELEMTGDQGRVRKLVIAGTMPGSLFQSQLVMSERRFLEMFPSQSGYSFFLAETDRDDAGARLEERLADRGFDATRTADRLAGYLIVENTYMSTFQTLGGLGLLLGTLGLAVVMARNVLERRAELALLQAIGFSRSSISWLVVSENGFVLVLGILMGTGTALLAVLPHLLSGAAQTPWAGLAATLLVILATGLLASVAAVAMSPRSGLPAVLRGEL